MRSFLIRPLAAAVRRLLGVRPHLRPDLTLIGCGCLLGAAIVATTSLLALDLRDAALKGAERELGNLALALAEETDRSFQSLAIVERGLIDGMRAQGVATVEAYGRQMAGIDAHRMLREKIEGLPQVDALTLIDAQGSLINFTRYWPIPAVNVADRDYFKALKSDPAADTFVSEPVPNRGTGTWTIYLARKFAGPEREFLGLVLGAIELKHFEDSFKAITLNPDSAIAMFRRDGILLARHPHIDPSIGRSYGASSNVFQGILPHADHGIARMKSRIDGQERLMAVRALPHYPVVISVTTTVAAALGEWRAQTQYLAALAALAVLVIGAAAALGTLLLRRQIASRDLVAQARAEAAEAERARAVAETELLKKERLSVLGQLTATVAHELRNPLSAIRNTVYAIGEAATAKGLKLERPMGRIERSIGRCDHIIADLLEYTRARELRRSPIRLDAWLGEVLDEQKLPEGVTLERRFAATGGIVELDLDRFRRVIINLVDNAAQAITDARSAVRTGRIVVSTLASAGVDIVIEDTGPGIPPEVLPRVFEPLFSTKSFGTGLGLPTVKQIVEQHGGSITIGSTPGRGTVVRIHLAGGDAARVAA
jgi:signal transduction histidine kinase